MISYPRSSRWPTKLTIYGELVHGGFDAIKKNYYYTKHILTCMLGQTFPGEHGFFWQSELCLHLKSEIKREDFDISRVTTIWKTFSLWINPKETRGFRGGFFLTWAIFWLDVLMTFHFGPWTIWIFFTNDPHAHFSRALTYFCLIQTILLAWAGL